MDPAWEFVFLDAERPADAGYWPDLLRALIEAEPTVTTALVPIGAGLRLVVKE